jgi:hypothetical protein
MLYMQIWIIFSHNRSYCISLFFLALKTEYFVAAAHRLFLVRTLRAAMYIKISVWQVQLPAMALRAALERLAWLVSEY